MKPLIIIPARGGSKGIPGKNIKLLNGKPLIQYTIDPARELFPDDQICVSTDDFNIKIVVEELGLKVPFLRPEALATDEAGTYEVLLHAIEFYETNLHYYPDTLILLQATSPFRNAKQIKEALELYNSDCEMVVSVKETKANPYLTLREEDKNGWLVKSKPGHFVRRQDAPKVYELNGAIYVINISALKRASLVNFTKVRKYVMDDISSVDIDTHLDWIFSEIIIKKGVLNCKSK